MTLHSKPVGVVFATTVLPASPVSGRPSAGLFVRGTRSAQPGDLCVRAGDRLVRVNGTSLVGMAAEDLDEVRARFFRGFFRSFNLPSTHLPLALARVGVNNTLGVGCTAWEATEVLEFLKEKNKRICLPFPF